MPSTYIGHNRWYNYSTSTYIIIIIEIPIKNYNSFSLVAVVHSNDLGFLSNMILVLVQILGCSLGCQLRHEDSKTGSVLFACSWMLFPVKIEPEDNSNSFHISKPTVNTKQSEHKNTYHTSDWNNNHGIPISSYNNTLARWQVGNIQAN